MIRFRLIKNDCPSCGEPMIPDKFDFYVCSGCGCQVCPPSDSKREVKRQIAEAAKGIPIRCKTHSSGSKSKSHADNSIKMGRPTTKELYDRLCR